MTMGRLVGKLPTCCKIGGMNSVVCSYLPFKFVFDGDAWTCKQCMRIVKNAVIMRNTVHYLALMHGENIRESTTFVHELDNVRKM